MFSMAEVRKIARLLQLGLYGDSTILVQRRALVQLITAHFTLMKSDSLCSAEADTLRGAISLSRQETMAVRIEGARIVRVWKGRFWITVGVGTVVVGGLGYLFFRDAIKPEP